MDKVGQIANIVYLAWWKCAKKYSQIVIVGHFLQNKKIFVPDNYVANYRSNPYTLIG